MSLVIILECHGYLDCFMRIVHGLRGQADPPQGVFAYAAFPSCGSCLFAFLPVCSVLLCVLVGDKKEAPLGRLTDSLGALLIGILASLLASIIMRYFQDKDFGSLCKE